jgi:DNA polymerase-3 subunit alpha
LLRDDQLLIVEGRVSNDDFSGGLRVNARRLYDIAAARSAFASLLRISCNGQADAGKLRELLLPYCKNVHASSAAAASEYNERKGCAVKVEYHNGDARVEMMLGDSWRVELQDELLTGLRTWLSEENVKVLYN